jgi:bacillolysin
LAFWVCNYTNLSSQEIKTFAHIDNPFVNAHAELIDAQGFIFVKKESNIVPGYFVSNFREFTNLSENDTLKLKKSDVSDDGVIHNEYAQFHNDLEVEAGFLFEHVKDGRVILINGSIIEGLKFSLPPIIDEITALKIALEYINADLYAWQDAQREQFLQEIENNPNATYYPKGKLLLGLNNNLRLVKENYHQVWSFNIEGSEPVFSIQIYIDAQSGQIIRNHSLRHQNGPGTTTYNGVQILDTRWAGGIFHGHHHLETNENNRRIQTRTQGYNHITNDEDDNWMDKTASQVSAHWTTTMAWDYFQNTHNRWGLDGNGLGVSVTANSNDGTCGAWWTSGTIQIANCLSNGDMTALDIVSHEFTHAITDNEADLTYAGESGALDESFSDIFATQLDGDWTIGELTPLGAFRSLSNPNSTGHPSTYIVDPLWFNTIGCTPVPGLPPGNDDCGVHANSGVQNHWFYLLSVGGGSKWHFCARNWCFKGC